MNRDQLQDSMIQQILDDMDIKTMMAILYDSMSEDYDKYSDEEILEEVKEYYPDLLPVEEPSTIGWFRPLIVYCSYMNKTQNPYRQQIIAQGRDPIDAPVLEVPARYRDRFKSYAEYQEAIAEMLNGMWRSTKWHTATCNLPPRWGIL